MNRSSGESLRCLVLGGSGFIGSHLVDSLLDIGHRVRVFDRPGVTSHLVGTNALLDVREGDFTSKADIAEAVLDCDVCFHLVSTTLPKTSNADPIYDLESNLIGSVQLLQCLVAAGVRKVIFTSSGGTVYGVPEYVPVDESHPTQPTCSYGIAKLAIEKYLELFRQLHGLEYSALRLSNPYGERQRISGSQGAVAVFLGKVIRGDSVEIWGDGSVIRDYIHVSDVVSALLACIGYHGDQRVLNVASGSGMSLVDMLKDIEEVTSRKATPIFLPGRPFDVPINVLANERAKHALQWEPKVDFRTGIARMAAWAAL